MAGTLDRGIRFDFWLFATVAAISTIGVVNLGSATSAVTGARSELYLQQVYWLAAGTGVAVLIAAIDYRFFERLAFGFYGGSIFTLIAVFLLGRSIRGTHRWIQIGSFQFQPSEFVKICVILALAKHLHHDARAERRTLRDLIFPGTLILGPLGLIMAQPDLGTALIVLLISVSILGLARMERRSFFTLLFGGTFTSIFSWFFILKEYQKERLTSFWYAEQHKLDSAYQSTQSLIAIGSGGIFGQGYMHGTQNQRRFIPDPFTDFPLAVWAQEMGLLGNLVLLGLYLALIMQALQIASAARDRFGAAVAVGVAGLFFWHVVFNVGMVSGILPVVGVTLPLFSYGGSSVLSMMIGVGLLMNVSMRRSAY